MSHSIAQMFVGELDHEMSLTRKCLERVPEERLSFKPHEKSMSLGRLASHIAESPQWAPVVLQQDVFDIAPPEGGASFESADLGSREEILDLFDRSLATCREALLGTSDEAFGESWEFRRGGEVELSMPRVAVFRSFVLNHNVHHRAQLGVYLRMCNVPVPAIYGPSADEEGM